MFILLLFIITLQSVSQLVSGRGCGGAWIDEFTDCICGDTNITWSDGHDNDCCGRDTCYVDQDGTVQCPDGQICQNKSYTFRCGDLILPNSADCHCGEEEFTLDDYWAHKWCCPSSSSPCSYKDDVSICSNGICVNAIGICIDGKVKTDKKAICPSGVTYDRNYYPCKSGEQVDKDLICRGTIHCKDGSDLDQCQENVDNCKPDYRSNYGKCPITSSGHSQCYQSSSQTNDKNYDCLNRADESMEIDHSDNIPYDRLTTCDYGSGRDLGVKCGEECKLIYQWCEDQSDDGVHSCTVGDTSFLSNDEKLCQNSEYWSDKTCNFYIGGIVNFGKRCSTLQHCYFPAYNRHDYGPDNTHFKLTCDDKTDQVHPVATTCNTQVRKFTEQYCKQFCPQQKPGDIIIDEHYEQALIQGKKVWIGEKCDEICSDIPAWIFNQTHNSILDPHNCQDIWRLHKLQHKMYDLNSA